MAWGFMEDMGMDAVGELEVVTSLLDLEEFEVVEIRLEPLKKVRHITIVP